jgi:competence CoiA-like predicted nuclease
MSILIGYDKDFNRIHISDYNKTTCGNVYCLEGHKLIAKKGSKKVHHYCHQSKCDCPYSNDMGDWHVYQQSRILPDFIEIRISVEEKYHIADVQNIDNVVIEYQSSIIPESVIKEREEFYTKYANGMVWLFNCDKYDIDIYDIYEEAEKRYISFKINKGSSFILSSSVDTYLDFDKNEYIRLISHDKYTCIGELVPITTFDEIYLSGILQNNIIYKNKHNFIK